ncbi:BTB/POZ domain-containing protein 6 [Aphelenchoides avenae]|nr:BTB/POZ domain-containing protein 6 [Aphelenchus avenae]
MATLTASEWWKSTDASPDGFLALSRYIYTDEVVITEDNVESVIQVADKYLLTGLLDECVKWLKENVSAANVCRFLLLGELYSEVGEVCWELALSHGNDTLNSEAFLTLPKNLLAKMFASDRLAADEVTIYGRAVDWAKRQFKTESMKAIHSRSHLPGSKK